ncbi:helix-turn-helix domain-containing protein [Microbacteriaceae bacterium VKM Ac-2855]|nr:helix-turn-helix domain-containing protein [Microbacteriaceae bacterium VKM Ac-2855]
MAATLQDIRGRGTITVEEAGEVVGIGRASAYAAVRSGELPSIRIGRRVVVPVPALLTLLGEAAHHEA